MEITYVNMPGLLHKCSVTYRIISFYWVITSPQYILLSFPSLEEVIPIPQAFWPSLYFPTSYYVCGCLQTLPLVLWWHLRRAQPFRSWQPQRHASLSHSHPPHSFHFQYPPSSWGSGQVEKLLATIPTPSQVRVMTSPHSSHSWDRILARFQLLPRDTSCPCSFFIWGHETVIKRVGGDCYWVTNVANPSVALWLQ